jgi:hypothetical protein
MAVFLSVIVYHTYANVVIFCAQMGHKGRDSYRVARHPVVCLSFGAPRQIRRAGCDCNRHGMTVGVKFWQRYWVPPGLIMHTIGIAR